MLSFKYLSNVLYMFIKFKRMYITLITCARGSKLIAHQLSSLRIISVFHFWSTFASRHEFMFSSWFCWMIKNVFFCFYGDVKWGASEVQVFERNLTVGDNLFLSSCLLAKRFCFSVHLVHMYSIWALIVYNRCIFYSTVKSTLK